VVALLFLRARALTHARTSRHPSHPSTNSLLYKKVDQVVHVAGFPADHLGSTYAPPTQVVQPRVALAFRGTQEQTAQAFIMFERV